MSQYKKAISAFVISLVGMLGAFGWISGEMAAWFSIENVELFTGLVGSVLVAAGVWAPAND